MTVVFSFVFFKQFQVGRHFCAVQTHCTRHSEWTHSGSVVHTFSTFCMFKSNLCRNVWSKKIVANKIVHENPAGCAGICDH